jgi:hypothetical protein
LHEVTHFELRYELAKVGSIDPARFALLPDQPE